MDWQDQRQGYNAVKFGPLSGGGYGDTNIRGSLDLLRDIRLQVSVELGRTSLPLKQVMQMMEGSVIELDQLAGEPVNVIAAGKIVAQGEVVVIGSNFGIKITKIFQSELSSTMG